MIERRGPSHGIASYAGRSAICPRFPTQSRWKRIATRFAAAASVVVTSSGCGGSAAHPPAPVAVRPAPVVERTVGSTPTAANAGAARCKPAKPVTLGATAGARAWIAYGPDGGFAMWADEGPGAWTTRRLAADGTAIEAPRRVRLPHAHVVPNRFVPISGGRFVVLLDEYVAERTPREATLVGLMDAKGGTIGSWSKIEGLDGVDVFDARGAGDLVSGLAFRNRPLENDPSPSWFDVRVTASGAVRATSHPIPIAFHSPQLRASTFFAFVRGQGPLAWIVISADEQPVQLLSDGRALTSTSPLPRGLSGIVAAWDGPRVRMALRDAATPAGQARVATLEPDGALRVEAPVPLAAATRPPIVDEVFGDYDMASGWSSGRAIGVGLGKPFALRDLDPEAGAVLARAYAPETAWSGERFLVGYVVRAGEKDAQARVVAMDCTP